MNYVAIKFWIFLAVFLTAYFLAPRASFRRFVILAGNLTFYLYSGFAGFVVMAVSSLAVWLAALAIGRTYVRFDEEKKTLPVPQQLRLFSQYKKKTLPYILAAGAAILGILVYVKVGRFLGLTSADLTHFRLGKSIIVPLGLSYYTFSTLGYLIDVYQGRIRPERNYFRFLLCVTYFPHIVAGPISRYEKLLPQFESLPGFDYARVCSGLQRTLWGYFKKSVVADTIAPVVVSIMANPWDNSLTNILLSVFLSVFQLYGDFSGCMDIAGGISEALGIELESNFERPFFSRNAPEIWRRWHITLGKWFKDYVYMPMANAKGFKKLTRTVRKKYGKHMGQVFANALPTLVVWLLTGLWHGTGWDYVLWGVYWATIINLSNLLDPVYAKMRERLHIRENNPVFRVFQSVRSFLLFSGCMVLSAPGSMGAVCRLLQAAFAKLRAGAWALDFTPFQNRTVIMLIFGGILAILVVDLIQEYLREVKKSTIRQTVAAWPLPVRWMLIYLLIFAILIYGRFGTTGVGVFMYEFF